MQFLVSIHHADNYDSSKEDVGMHRDIDALNEEMVAAGIRVFVGGLHPASQAKTIKREPKGQIIAADGPYLPTGEHVGGFWVLDLNSIEEAVAWGRKAAEACRAPVEVRQFH